MNNDSPNDKDRLLNDVLREDSFDAFNQDLQRRAMGTFRRARLVRRVATASAVAALMSCLVVAALLTGRSGKSPVGIAAIVPSATTAPVEINERQLVELFPPDSCFVAEVNGKKVLVFKDAELREQFLN